MLIRAVAFDLDGTLIDSAGDIAAATNHSLAQAGFAQLELSKIRSYVGDGSIALMERASGLDRGDRRFSGLMSDFLNHYSELPVAETTLLPGALEVLTTAKRHFRLALCTNKPRRLTSLVLAGLDLERYFDVVVAAGDVPEPKPHPAPLQSVAEQLKVSTRELVLVGDGPQDIGCAKAAGCRSIGVTEEAIHPLGRLIAAGPDACVPLREVPRQLSDWNEQSAAGGASV